MIVSPEQAKDEILALFNVAWNANAAAIVGYVPEVRWPNVEEAALPGRDMYWARVSMQTVMEEQAALAIDVAAIANRKYETAGLIFVQLFCPKVETAGTKGLQLATIARNAYRGKRTSPGNVNFYNVRIMPLEPEALFKRFNIVAEYEYNELG